MRFKEALERAEAEDNDEHSSGLTILSFRDLRDGIAEAVSAERERCVKIFEAFIEGHGGSIELRDLLTLIRKGE